ncbi:MAG TPA: hypothetical protein VKA48_06065 [Gammaproteobacteria bacterium]|nr:hypothetical protein [Gammaproteobacteria bacterium]
MKRILTLGVALAAALFLVAPAVAAKSPYTAASYVTGGSIDQVVSKVKGALGDAGFNVVGSYHPLGKGDRAVVVVTDPAMLKAIKAHPTTDRGGHTIAGAGLRVGVYKPQKAPAEVSYTNPTYLYSAYFQGDYSKVKSQAKDAQDRLQQALGGIGQGAGKGFGGKVKELTHYHYMIFMPYFEDDIELATHSDFQSAVRAVRSNLGQGVAHTKKVYEVMMPGSKLAVFGVAMNGKKKGTPSWYPKLIQRHVAALPYEVYVVGNKTYMLHGRYRIALSWPELTMATFSNIMDAPGNIEDVMRKVAGSD